MCSQTWFKRECPRHSPRQVPLLEFQLRALMPPKENRTEVVSHQVWGEPEIISGYSSSGQEYSDGVSFRRDDASGNNRPLPVDAEQHISDVQQERDSGSQSSSSSDPEPVKALPLQYIRPKVWHDCESDSDSSLFEMNRSRPGRRYVNMRRESDSGSPSSSTETDTSCQRHHQGRTGVRKQDDNSPPPSSSENDTVGPLRGPARESRLFAPTEQPRRQLGMPSKGSALHANGQCKPCIYVKAPSGCWYGADCEFCHMNHVKKSARKRPDKRTRARCQQIMAFLELGTVDPENMVSEEPKNADSGTRYFHSLIRGRRKTLQAKAEQAKSRIVGQGSEGSGEEDAPDTGASGSGSHPDSDSDTGDQTTQGPFDETSSSL